MEVDIASFVLISFLIVFKERWCKETIQRNLETRRLQEEEANKKKLAKQKAAEAAGEIAVEGGDEDDEIPEEEEEQIEEMGSLNIQEAIE